MQVILNLNEIISHVQHKTKELENYYNYRTTDNTLLAIQNSSCIEKTLMESISVIGFSPTATGLSVSLTINQFESSENNFSIVSTSYFGRELDISNTYLINENLFKCKCLFLHQQILILPIYWKPTLHTQTHTHGVLFPFFTPFTVTDSTLNNKLPQQQTNLPFHVTTGNPIKIAFQQHTYFKQI